MTELLKSIESRPDDAVVTGALVKGLHDLTATLIAALRKLNAPTDVLAALESGDIEHVLWWIDSAPNAEVRHPAEPG